MKDTRHHQKRLLCRATPIKRGYPRPFVHWWLICFDSLLDAFRRDANCRWGIHEKPVIYGRECSNWKSSFSAILTLLTVRLTTHEKGRHRPSMIMPTDRKYVNWTISHRRLKRSVSICWFELSFVVSPTRNLQQLCQDDLSRSNCKLLRGSARTSTFQCAVIYWLARQSRTVASFDATLPVGAGIFCFVQEEMTVDH
jgi:hypothetical protein